MSDAIEKKEQQGGCTGCCNNCKKKQITNSNKPLRIKVRVDKNYI